MKKNIKFGAIAVALLAVAPVFSSASIVKADTQQADVQQTNEAVDQKQGNLKEVTMKRGGFIYDQNGNFAINNQRFIFFKKGKTLGAWNNGKVVKINGEKFYQVGENQFVKLDCIKSKKNKQVKLNKHKKHMKKANKKALQKKNKKFNKRLAKKFAKKVIVVD